MESSASWAALGRLFDAQRWDQLEDRCLEGLEEDPTDVCAHYFLAWSLLRQDRAPEAKLHVDFVLSDDPASADYQHLGSVFHWQTKSLPLAESHNKSSINLCPENGFYHYWAACLALERNQTAAAQRHIATAKRLDPENPDIASLHIRMSSITETSAADAWRRIEKYEEALALDPENDSLIAGIGDVHLTELDDPKTAEGYFRQALLIDPSDRQYQKDLFQAVARRNLLYRLFTVPEFGWSALRNTGRTVNDQPLRLILLLLAFKLILAFFVWLIVVSVLFYPPAKCFEWLLISEIRSLHTSNTRLKAWAWFHRWPFYARFSLSLVLIGGFWLLLFRAFSIELIKGLTFIGWVAGIHLCLLLILMGIRRIRAWFGKRAASKKA